MDHEAGSADDSEEPNPTRDSFWQLRRSLRKHSLAIHKEAVGEQEVRSRPPPMKRVDSPCFKCLTRDVLTSAMNERNDDLDPEKFNVIGAPAITEPR